MHGGLLVKLAYFTATFGNWILIRKGEPTNIGSRPGDTLLRPGIPLERYLPTLSEIGYDGVGLCTWPGHNAYPWSLDSKTKEKIIKMFKETGLNIYALGSHGGSRHVFDRFGYLTTDIDEFNERILYTKKCIELAAHLGVSVIDDVTGDIPNGVSEDEAFDRLAKIFKDICNYAEEYNVHIGIEPYTGPIGSPEAFWRLKEMVNHSKLGCTLDYSNLIANGTVTSAQDSAKKLCSAVVHIHLKGRSSSGSLATPGGESDTCDLKEFLQVMHKNGYNGTLTLEEYPESYKPALSPLQAAKAGYISVSKIMNELEIRS
jgi:sugar phosphate isomerase/epimerase